jgi:hypothetical protein
MIIPDKNYFTAATTQVIKSFEGGYFHPKMYINNPKKFKGYETSGETMFGLDRHAGFDIYYKGKRKTDSVQDNLKYIESGAYEYKTPAAKEFWTIIDKADAKNKWKWLDRGFENEDKLTLLASEIIYPTFLNYADRFLDDDAKKLVYSDPRLLFHFVYATWNGPNFFKFYAQELNKQIENKKNIDSIINEQLNFRINSKYSQIRDTGAKMAKLFTNENFKKKFKELADQVKTTVGNNSKLLPILLTGLIIAGYFITRKLQKA